MENASKALLMAGGVLIAIIIIAALVKTTNIVGNFQKSKLTEEEQERLITFNEQYTKYLGKYVYGTDVITVINKALDNNDYTITVKIQFASSYTYNVNEWDRKKCQYVVKEITVRDGKELSFTNDNDEYASSFIEYSTDNDFKNRAFKCTSVNYDSYGRVNAIKFEEKKWGDLT